MAAGPSRVVLPVVAALLAGPAGRYLAQQRRADAARPNLWEFPGGKVEPGETAEQALARELREELGVEVSVGARLASVRHAYAELTIDLSLHAATLVAGEPRPLDAQALAWVTPQEARRLAFSAADVALIEVLEREARW